jgi:hypothetical protein
MVAITLRIISTTWEAIIAGIAISLALYSVRRIQLALGVKDDEKERQAQVHWDR